MHTGMQDVCMYHVVLLCVMHTDFYHNSALLYIHTGRELDLNYWYWWEISGIRNLETQNCFENCFFSENHSSKLDFDKNGINWPACLGNITQGIEFEHQFLPAPRFRFGKQ